MNIKLLIFHVNSLTHHQIAMLHPDVVTSCNVDLENLISDSNRSIATLAITTLLKVQYEGVLTLYSSLFSFYVDWERD